jgi:hypothetical protein
MFPRHEPALSFRKISDFWPRRIDPPASSDELLSILVGAWWLGELRGNARHSRLQLLRMMFTSQYKDDLAIVFVVGDGEGSREDESLEVDLRSEIVVPSSNTGHWDEAACNEAFERMAQITERSLFEKRRLFESYQEFAIFLPSIELTFEEFTTWCSKRGYDEQKFWKPRAKLVTPQERKTWQAKPGKSLTASESAVFKAINEIWPDGTIDQKAQARDDRILKQLKTASQHPVSRRTIQRTIQKIHFR